MLTSDNLLDSSLLWFCQTSYTSLEDSSIALEMLSVISGQWQSGLLVYYLHLVDEVDKSLFSHVVRSKNLHSQSLGDDRNDSG